MRMRQYMAEQRKEFLAGRRRKALGPMAERRNRLRAAAWVAASAVVAKDALIGIIRGVGASPASSDYRLQSRIRPQAPWGTSMSSPNCTLEAMRTQGGGALFQVLVPRHLYNSLEIDQIWCIVGTGQWLQLVENVDRVSSLRQVRRLPFFI